LPLFRAADAALFAAKRDGRNRSASAAASLGPVPLRCEATE
jgi:hypothetical protein